MEIFVDTSALYAAMDEDDPHHFEAKSVLNDHINEKDYLVCSNYVIVETFTLIQRRLGIEAVRDFQVDVIPLLRIEWVSKTTHEAGAAALLIANQRRLSLVDCTSFVLMRQLEIRIALAFDSHFHEQGFKVIP